jgi:hemolysin activation/secretion protein
VRAIVTPRSVLAVALEGAAGTSTGSVPLQSRFYLGGPATLRGYDGAVTAGNAYWRGRLEVANAFPAVRLAAFTDLGWAGARADFGKGRALIGSGIGASFLDGLVRLDLARALRSPTGWRFDLYFDARL